MEKTTVLDRIVILVLGISLWSGRKKLRQEDLRLADGSELPPEQLASLGSKKVMDPKALAPFANYKRQAERAALSVGTRFLGGYAIPIDKLESVMQEVSGIEAEFSVKKKEFLADYDQAVSDWKAKNPGWQEVISRAVEDVEYVRKQIAFGAQTFRINPVPGHDDGLNEELGGLANQLRHEIKQMVRTAWEDSYKGKLEVGQKALRPIKAAVEKIDGLSFLEPALCNLVDTVRTSLEGLPKSGPIKGADLAIARGILNLLGDIPEAEDLAEYAPVEEETSSSPPEFELSDEEIEEIISTPHPAFIEQATTAELDIWF